MVELERNQLSIFILSCHAVPNNILDMVYEIGAGITMNGRIMQTLANVWHNEDSNFPLYVCSITKSQLGPRGQFVRFSTDKQRDISCLA